MLLLHIYKHFRHYCASLAERKKKNVQNSALDVHVVISLLSHTSHSRVFSSAARLLALLKSTAEVPHRQVAKSSTYLLYIIFSFFLFLSGALGGGGRAAQFGATLSTILIFDKLLTFLHFWRPLSLTSLCLQVFIRGKTSDPLFKPFFNIIFNLPIFFNFVRLLAGWLLFLPGSGSPDSSGLFFYLLVMLAEFYYLHVLGDLLHVNKRR